MLTAAHELYDKVLIIYKTQYDKLKQAHQKNIKVQDMPDNLSIDLYLDEDHLPPIPTLESNKWVKLEPEEIIAERGKLNPRKRKNGGKGLKILTPNRLLTRLPILLTQTKSWKQFMQIKKWNQTNTIYFVSA